MNPQLRTLKHLAERASILDHNESPNWYSQDYLQSNGISYRKNAQFISAVTPNVVLNLVDRLTKKPKSRRVFNYSKAFTRNIGWVTEEEQDKLKSLRIAIAGLGGVGGAHLRTLARLGVGNFHLSDFDTFGIHNFNRQAGAFVSTLGKSKLATIAAMAKDINPLINLKGFPSGVLPENVDEFLTGIDIYVDGLDFFALPARRMVYAKCRQLGIPVLTAAPLGMGVAFLYFPPDGMSADDYFKWDGHEPTEQYARFIAGLSPAMLSRSYLAVADSVSFTEKRGPSTVMACDLCAAVMATQVLKLALDRGQVKPVPHAMQFDAYHQSLKWTWRPGGNSNPLQWLLLKFIRPILKL